METNTETVDPFEVLITAKDYLDRLIPGIEETANQLRSGSENEGSRTMVDIVDGLHWLADVIMLTTDQQKTKIDYMEIVPFFELMNEALENLDYVYLGDLLEYEIVPILERWRTKLIHTVGV